MEQPFSMGWASTVLRVYSMSVSRESRCRNTSHSRSSASSSTSWRMAPSRSVEFSSTWVARRMASVLTDRRASREEYPCASKNTRAAKMTTQRLRRIEKERRILSKTFLMASTPHRSPALGSNPPVASFHWPWPPCRAAAGTHACRNRRPSAAGGLPPA